MYIIGMYSVCLYLRMYVCTVYVRMYVCTIYVRMYSVCIIYYVRMYVRMYVCTYVCMYVHRCWFVYVTYDVFPPPVGPMMAFKPGPIIPLKL